MALTEQQLQQVKSEHPEWFIDIKEGNWYKRVWEDGDIDVFQIKKKKGDMAILIPYYRGNEYIGGNEDHWSPLIDERFKILEATPEEVAAVHKPSISEAIEAFKKHHPEYNLTIIAEKK